MTRIHFPALLLLALGLTGILGGLQYEIGSLTSMRPGFMPLLYGIGLSALALILLVQHWLAGDGAAPDWRALLRPLLTAGGSILAWALLAEPAGFFVAAIVQLLLAYAAVPQPSWPRAVVISVVVSVLAYGLFVAVLNIPLRAW